MKRFVFTCGDINGIGPEVVIKTFEKIFKSGQLENSTHQLIFLCPINVFEEAYKLVNAGFNYSVSKKTTGETGSSIVIVNTGKAKIKPGIPTSKSGKISFKSIKSGFKLVNEKKADALITAPVSKKALKLAGINFTGHTEMLAKWSGKKNVVMMFLSENMKAALLTIHQPVKKVPELVTKKRLLTTIEIIHNSLLNNFGITQPALALLGLNPHAGEDGLIGREEEKIIKPLLKKLSSNYNLSGPFPADGFFGSEKYKDFDAVLGMYHDQVLIPFKLLNFSTGVNFTAGLPIIRTSPDHGTAFDIAWQNKADETSLFEAFRYAKIISENRENNAGH